MSGPFDRLLYLGEVVIDVVLYVPALPERGSDVLASATWSTPGGGFNVMAAATRQGLPVTYAGALGTGPFAALAASGLAAEGIGVLQQPKPGLDTGTVISMVDRDGERTFVTGQGAEAALTAEDLAPVVAGPRDAVALSGYGLAYDSNRPALLGWLSRLDAASIVFLDPGPLAGRLPPAALAAATARADWLSCNAAEATALTGRPDPAAAASALAARFPATQRRGGVIVRTGPAGCLLAAGAADPAPIPGFPVRATDTSGAGDAHLGAFIASLAAGRDPAEAARRANAAAALSVTRPGPATAPTAAELTRFLAAHP